MKKITFTIVTSVSDLLPAALLDTLADDLVKHVQQTTFANMTTGAWKAIVLPVDENERTLESDLKEGRY